MVGNDYVSAGLGSVALGISKLGELSSFPSHGLFSLALVGLWVSRIGDF